MTTIGWAILRAAGGAAAAMVMIASAGAARAAQPWGTDSRPVEVPKRAAAETARGASAVGFPQYPSLSPDGRWMVFSSAGDLWISPIKGGFCTRLTSHPAEDRRSVWSPDGAWLAFESSRDGARNLYVMAIAVEGEVATGGPPVRVGVSDQPQALGSFTPDGAGLLFASSKEPSVYRSARMFRLDLRRDAGGAIVGGGAVSRLTDAFGQGARMSPDGKSVVFWRNNTGLERPRYRGSGSNDVYRLLLGNGGGGFDRLTDDPANDFDGWPLPDGSVVFVSSRDGQNNVWRVRGGGSGQAAEQLTAFAPKADELTIGHGVRDLAVSADGSVAVFAVWDTLYRLDLKSGGSKPQAIALRAAGDSVVPEFHRMNLEREVSEQALSPDGKTLAVVARGEVFVRSTQEGYPTRRVTETSGRERDLAWSPDGRVLYFASDDAGAALPEGARRGTYGVYAATVTLTREDLQPKKPAPAPKPADEKKDEPAKADAGGAEPPPPGAAEPEPASKPEPAKDAEKPAEKAEKKDTKPDHGKRWAEALRFGIEAVIAPGISDARSPAPSPDGRKLLYVRGLGDLVLRDLESKAERVLVESFDDPDPVWAADSRHVLYAINDLDFNSDIWLMDTGDGADSPEASNRRGYANPVNLTRHPDTDASPRLSADGKVLTFVSERGGENGEMDVYQIYLDKSLDAMSAYERDEYFKKASEAAGKRKPLGAAEAKPSDRKADAEAKDDKKEEKKDDGAEKKDKAGGAPGASEPLKFDAADAYMRVRRLVSLPGAEGTLAVTPGGDRVIFSATAEGDRALMSVDHKGGDRKTLQAGGVGDVNVSLTGDKVLFVRQGVVNSTNPKSGGKVDALPIDAPVVIDVARQQRQKFLEAAKALGMIFYHPTLKGLDWPGLTARYLTLAERTRSNEEFNRVGQMLFGELDASHIGISGGTPFVPSAPSPSIGYLGITSKPAPGGFELLSVAAETPAAAGEQRLNPGDVIVAVDGVRLAPDDASLPTMDLDAAMAGRAGKETLIEVRRATAPAGEAAEAPARATLLLLTPMSSGAWDVAQYWDEVRQRQKKVDELSGGRLGYLHIRAMGESAVRDFERDLYAAGYGKEGLIIDVRDNGGGSTADILLSSLTAPRHAWTAPRVADPGKVPQDSYPRDRRLIYAWTRPINVLINQNSFSNAEIFAHAIKTIGRGKLIGTATYGGVISTGGTTLIDGTTVRMPMRGWYLPDGTDMDNNGAKPDVEVAQTPEDEVAGRDRQLEAAVQELLGRVGQASAGGGAK